MSKQVEETLKIEGMSCGHCIRAVQGALASVPGVEVQGVEIGSAQVSYDAEAVDRQDLVDSLEEAGYSVA